jgi:hypothetical protein
VRFGEHGVADDLIHVEGIPSGEPGKSIGDARWCAKQPFARGILPEELQNPAHERFELGVVLRSRIKVEPSVELGQLER